MVPTVLKDKDLNFWVELNDDGLYYITDVMGRVITGDDGAQQRGATYEQLVNTGLNPQPTTVEEQQWVAIRYIFFALKEANLL